MQTVKAVLLAAIIHVVCVAPAGGQGLTVGIKGGPVWTNIGGDDAGDFESRTDISVGGSISYALNEAVALQPEVLYTPKGAAAEAVEGTGDVRLTYLDFPLLLNLSHPAVSAGSVRPHLLVGPAVSVRLNCEVEAQVGEQQTALDCDDPLLGGELSTKGVDWGILFGGGVQATFGRASLVADGRYNVGMQSFDDGPAAQDVKNRALSILVGLSYRIR